MHHHWCEPGCYFCHCFTPQAAAEVTNFRSLDIKTDAPTFRSPSCFMQIKPSVHLQLGNLSLRVLLLLVPQAWEVGLSLFARFVEGSTRKRGGFDFVHMAKQGVKEITKRSRASKPKVTTGCLTCKHVSPHLTSAVHMLILRPGPDG